MKAQVIPVTGLRGPRKTVFDARLVITEQEGVSELAWNFQGDASIAERLQKLLEEIVAQRNKPPA